MELNKYNSFANFWQSLVTNIKTGFVTGCITATQSFKKTYEHKTGMPFDPTLPDIKTIPIAIEPMVANNKKGAVGCYIFMPNGYIFEGIVREDTSDGIVHLVWIVSTDATKRPIFRLDKRLFGRTKAKEGAEMKTE